jgi:hypothetical protein
MNIGQKSSKAEPVTYHEEASAGNRRRNSQSHSSLSSKPPVRLSQWMFMSKASREMISPRTTTLSPSLSALRSAVL